MNNQQLKQFFADVQAGKVEIEKFEAAIDIHVHAQVAELKLNALQWKQRYENANEMAKSLMSEFQDRGLMYTAPYIKYPPPKTLSVYNYQPKPKKD